MKISRTALVTYSAEKMYRLVEHVPAYPEFLSWCTGTEVHEQSDVFQKASLTVVVAGVRQQFTTRNTLVQGESIEMQLDRGPFKNLQGQWRFLQLGEVGCKISLELDFEMTSALMSGVFGKGFGKIADRLVDDFCRRAEQVYRWMNARGPSAPIRVEVVLAMPERQVLVELSMAPGSTVAEAIAQSGIQEKFQGFQIDLGMVGVFGKKTPPEHVLREGDRVEIYRPLLADPKESRRQRAARQNNKEPAR